MSRFRRVSMLSVMSLGALTLAVSAPVPPATAADDHGDTAVRYADKAAEIRRRADELRDAGRFDAADRIETRARNVEDRGAEMKSRTAQRAELKDRVELLRAELLQAQGEDRDADAQAARRELQELSRSLKVVRPAADEFAPRSVDADLVRQAQDLRARAEDMRSRGLPAEAVPLEDELTRVARTLQLRRASNDLGRMSMDALAVGSVGDARQLATASASLWRESRDASVAPLTTSVRQRRRAAQAAPDRLPADVAATAASLRTAARDLREAGKKDDAAKAADRAAALERSATRLRDAERGEVVLARVSDIARLRAEFTAAMEESRKRIAEAEEAIRKARPK